MNKTLKIATFNINSLRSRLPILLSWLKKEQPDLLALQETKVPDELFPKEVFEKEGWNVVFKGQKAHNGVAIISKEPLKNVKFRLYPNLAEEDARVIGGIYKGIKIFNTYVPQGYMIGTPQFQKKLKFFSDLRLYFRREMKKDEPALWLGDLNVAQTEIDLARPKANEEHVCFHIDARRALEQTMEGVWIDLFRLKEKAAGHYTFWSARRSSTFKQNIGWRVDLILGTKVMVPRLKRIWNDKKVRGTPGASDHTFLAAEFSL